MLNLVGDKSMRQLYVIEKLYFLINAIGSIGIYGWFNRWPYLQFSQHTPHSLCFAFVRSSILGCLNSLVSENRNFPIAEAKVSIFLLQTVEMK